MEDNTIEIFKQILNAPDEAIDFKDAIKILCQVTSTINPSAVKGFLDMNKDLTEKEITTVINLVHSIQVSYALTLYNCMGHEKEVKEMLSGTKNTVLIRADATQEEMQEAANSLKEKVEKEAIKEMN